MIVEEIASGLRLLNTAGLWKKGKQEFIEMSLAYPEMTQQFLGDALAKTRNFNQKPYWTAGSIRSTPYSFGRTGAKGHVVKEPK